MNQDAANYDAIVIGSGIGGMTAAGLLAAVGGRRVLVLEKHTEPGGFTHAFRRDGASWDVGLHYMGDLATGSMLRSFFDFLSGGKLHWNRLPDDFDRFVYPDLSLAVPSDPQLYRQRLEQLFPAEAPAIERYFRAVRRALAWSMLGSIRGMVPQPVAPLLRLAERLSGFRATQTTGRVLQRLVRSPQLRSLLATQWGDYGLPPSRSAFAIHAQIVTHYLHGAWFPQGGAGRIARTFEKGIERAGGAIRVAQEVVQIVVEQGRAVGVRVIDRRGPVARELSYRAPLIISDAGALLTYERLLPTDGPVGQRTAAVRALMASMRGGLSAVTLYLRLKASASTLGVRGENYWVNADYAHDDIDTLGRDLLAGQARRLYLSFPSLKSGDDRVPTAEIICFVDDGLFARWRDSHKGHRGAEYLDLKARISRGLLVLAETAVPGLSGLVAYAELSTPLTIEHYTSHPHGLIYGLPATPARYRSALLGPRSPVPGLLLAGADAGCLGVSGAMMGGVAAASQALGSRGFPMIQAELRKGLRPVAGEAPLPAGKAHALLVARVALTPSIWRVEFDLDRELGPFAPGQFARIRVAEFDWRDYSIASLDGRRLVCLISTRTGGLGSRFAATAALGGQTVIEGPLGQFTLVPGTHRRVFVATGTGLAPFLPMFRQLAGEGTLASASLYFGCRTQADDITPCTPFLPGTVERCISGEVPPAGARAGRVTQALKSCTFDPDDTHFYLCGSGAMVSDAAAVLAGRGARHMHTELY